MLAPRRVAELRAVYGASMQAMLDGLGGVLPAGSSFTRPQGGVFVWAELAEGWSTTTLLERGIEPGIFFMPGSLFLADVPDDRSLRLSISNHTPHSLAEGLSCLAKAVAAMPSPAGVT